MFCLRWLCLLYIIIYADWFCFLSHFSNLEICEWNQKLYGCFVVGGYGDMENHKISKGSKSAAAPSKSGKNKGNPRKNLARKHEGM